MNVELGSIVTINYCSRCKDDAFHDRKWQLYNYVHSSVIPNNQKMILQANSFVENFNILVISYSINSCVNFTVRLFLIEQTTRWMIHSTLSIAEEESNV